MVDYVANNTELKRCSCNFDDITNHDGPLSS